MPQFPGSYVHYARGAGVLHCRRCDPCPAGDDRTNHYFEDARWGNPDLVPRQIDLCWSALHNTIWGELRSVAWALDRSIGPLVPNEALLVGAPEAERSEPPLVSNDHETLEHAHRGPHRKILSSPERHRDRRSTLFRTRVTTAC